MKIAYCIIAHKDPVQLERLIKALYIKDTTSFYIHIDRKANIKLFENLLNSAPNIQIIKKRINVKWGAYSQCESQISLLESVLSDNVAYNRIFFLSGLDYPLWSNNHILDYLKNNDNKELIMAFNLTKSRIIKQQNKVIKYYFNDTFKILGRLSERISLFINKLIAKLKLKKENSILIEGKRYDVFMGSSWFCLTYDCAKYVMYMLNRHPKITKYFKYSFTPDEMMIHTIVFNSHFAQNAILHNGDYPQLVNLTPLHYIEYTNKIAIYTYKDFDKLIESNKMFVRKLETKISDELISMIDAYRKGMEEKACARDVFQRG